jgi:thiamine biosynthesis lipoprotein
VGCEVVRLKLSVGALATSAVTRRTWGPGLHHVIDPRTGRPAITRVLQATAWAATCAEAEVRATWALLAGPAILERLPAILFQENGPALTNLCLPPTEPADATPPAASPSTMHTRAPGPTNAGPSPSGGSDSGE